MVETAKMPWMETTAAGARSVAPAAVPAPAGSTASVTVPAAGAPSVTVL